MGGIRVLCSSLCILMSCWGVFGYQCCKSYTDLSGTYHSSMLCEDYCCMDIALQYRVCCSESWRQVPSSQRDQESCTENWIAEHINERCDGQPDQYDARRI
ncbi:hypothetical protein MAR_024671 [Mya arenaria]|uniref:Shisa N-terminal domain-containing protein n=1 Tax=Mya arenaria TaxID=6604 RepID=A0ABY7DTU0_MYAAR|nr:hypothetical protein MAR_024671 [Mya arenaria]